MGTTKLQEFICDNCGKTQTLRNLHSPEIVPTNWCRVEVNWAEPRIFCPDCTDAMDVALIKIKNPGSTVIKLEDETDQTSDSQVHDHGIDPSCPEGVYEGKLRGKCMIDKIKLANFQKMIKDAQEAVAKDRATWPAQDQQVPHEHRGNEKIHSMCPCQMRIGDHPYPGQDDEAEPSLIQDLFEYASEPGSKGTVVYLTSPLPSPEIDSEPLSGQGEGSEVPRATSDATMALRALQSQKLCCYGCGRAAGSNGYCGSSGCYDCPG